MVFQGYGSKVEVGWAENEIKWQLKENWNHFANCLGLALFKKTHKHTSICIQNPWFLHTDWKHIRLWIFLKQVSKFKEAKNVCCCQSQELSWTSLGNSCINISYIGCLPQSTSLQERPHFFPCSVCCCISYGLTEEHYV